MGVREISALNSGNLMPKETFSWKFDASGRYTYVDGIVIGYSGEIIVEQDD